VSTEKRYVSELNELVPELVVSTLSLTAVAESSSVRGPLIIN